MLTQLSFVRCCRLTAAISTLLLTACVDHSAPSVSDTAATTQSTEPALSQDISTSGRTDKRRTPITIQYQMSDAAVVGEEVAVTLQFGSKSEEGVLEIHYRSSSPQSLAIDPAQPKTVLIEANTAGHYVPQTVILLPYENGRFYLQISAGLQTQKGLLMRPYSIPVQVGPSTIKKASHKAGAQDDTEQGISIPARMD